MSVSSTEHLDKLAFILYDRPAGRNIIGYAIEHIEQLRADLATQQSCCDGAAAQDAHIRREREEHRAEVEKLRAENERLRADRRERIATAAMQGMLASAELVAPPVHAGFIAKWAVVYADALIAKLDEEGKS